MIVCTQWPGDDDAQNKLAIRPFPTISNIPFPVFIRISFDQRFLITRHHDALSAAWRVSCLN